MRKADYNKIKAGDRLLFKGEPHICTATLYGKEGFGIVIRHIDSLDEEVRRPDHRLLKRYREEERNTLGEIEALVKQNEVVKISDTNLKSQIVTLEAPFEQDKVRLTFVMDRQGWISHITVQVEVARYREEIERRKQERGNRSPFMLMMVGDSEDEEEERSGDNFHPNWEMRFETLREVRLFFKSVLFLNQVIEKHDPRMSFYNEFQKLSDDLNKFINKNIE